MPRPKRSKVASAVNPIPRAGPAKAPKPARKAVAEDIEDGDEGDDEVFTSVRRLSRSNPKKTATETRAAVTTSAVLRKGRGKEAAGKQGAEYVEDISEREAVMPSIETSRREAAWTYVKAKVPDLRRGRGSKPKPYAATRKGPDDLVSSIESDLAVAPITLPRMGNTILGQPTFRGRARQRAPSILGKGAGAARMRSSSMGLDMRGDSSAPGTAQSTRFGLIKGRRRERQPSLLGSNRKKMLMQQEAEQRAGEEDEDEDMDDFDAFNPDDESTPLNVQKTKSLSASNHSSVAVPVPTSSNSRKRRKVSEVEISEIQVPRSPPPPRSSPPLLESDIYGLSPPVRPSQAEAQTTRHLSPSLHSEEDIYGASPEVRVRPVEAQIIHESQSRSATPETERLASEQAPLVPSTPHALSETHAPPMSSSPVTPTFPKPNQSPSRRRQILATQDSPISSPPSLTHSPNYKSTKPPTKKRATKKAKAEAPLTTALLQNLLPHRRRRKVRREESVLDTSSDEELDISGLRSDDDELSFLTALDRRGKIRTPGIKNGQAKISGAASTKTAAKKPVRKAKQNAKAATTSSIVKGTKHTYGSQAASANKENLSDYDEAEEDGEGDDSLPADANATPEDSQQLEERIGKEMKQMKRKFEMVDEWEMEFEDVQGNSSDDKRMADAR